MKYILRNNGFTFVEVMLAGALLGGIGLTGSAIYKNMMKGQGAAQTKMEELDIRRQINTLLSDKVACTNTFGGTTMGSNISSLKNAAGVVNFQVGSIYGKETLKIESMQTLSTGQTFSDGTQSMNLILNFEQLKSGSIKKKKTVIPLRVKVASVSSPIMSCFADADQIVVTSCLSAGGIWNGTSCTFDNLYVKKTSDTMTGSITAPTFNGNVNAVTGSFLNSIIFAQGTASNKVTSPLFCTGTYCKSIGDLALSNQECPAGQVQTAFKANGLPECVALQCPTNQFFAGLDALGQVTCRPYPTKSCPTNQYVMKSDPDGTVTCGILPNNAISTCPAGQVLQSINVGIPTCIDIYKIACESSGGVWNGTNCSYANLYVLSSGDTMSGSLTAPAFYGNVFGSSGSFISVLLSGSATASNKIVSSLFCSGSNCKSIGDLALSNRFCPGQFLVSGIKADGTPDCSFINCSSGYYFAGLDGAGNSVCRPNPTNTCPTNQYVAQVNQDGTVVCANLPNNAISSCPAGQVLQSINAGIPTCVNKGAGTTCSVGQIVTAIAADGTVTCTTPPPQVAGGSCASGQVVVSISSSGVVTCANPPSRITGGSCSSGQFVVGVNANGTPICQGVACN